MAIVFLSKSEAGEKSVREIVKLVERLNVCIKFEYVLLIHFFGRFPSFAQVNFTLDYLDARFSFLKS